jgi:hypothetical protein
MVSSGAVVVPTAISVLCIALVEVPSAWLLSHRFDRTLGTIACPTPIGQEQPLAGVS